MTAEELALTSEQRAAIDKARGAIDTAAIFRAGRDSAVRRALAEGMNPRQIERALGPDPDDPSRPRLSATHIRRIAERRDQ